MATFAGLASDLAAGRTTSEGLVEKCLERISDPAGEGPRTYIRVDGEVARRTAIAIDALRDAGVEPSPLAGIPISVKDLFNVRGQATRAGSRVLDGAPAEADADAVGRCRRAGLIPLGRTNMTEFAYSGLGINPHHGTPANPWDRQRRRLPGGSSSGAAISVADELAYAGLGSDTGGSCRIPAALCGLVGYKPTQRAVARAGMLPLSTTLDSVGWIANSVGCCATLHDLLSDGEPVVGGALARPPRLAVVDNYFTDDIEPAVSAAYDRAQATLRTAGATLVQLRIPELDGLAEMNAAGGFPAAEAFAWHRELIETSADLYDPRVLSRILRGRDQTARDWIVLRERRTVLIDAVGERLEGIDAFICPTVPLLAPPLDVLDDDEEYARVNLLMLRNPTVVNLIDGCGASVPMHRPGEPPTGLTVAGLAGEDRTVLRVAAWIEENLWPR